MNLKGITPIIATVLLVAIVIILASIVYVWSFGFFKNGISKNGEPIERACEDALFEAQIVNSTSGYFLDANHQGTVSIDGFDIRLISETRSDSVSVRFSLPLQPGQTNSSSLKEFKTVYESRPIKNVLVIPVLVGEQDGVPQEYRCPDSAGIYVEVLR
jgi:flagellin-like protein